MGNATCPTHLSTCSVLRQLTPCCHASLLPVCRCNCRESAVCEGAPPPLPHNSWPTTCRNSPVGTQCQGACLAGFASALPPTATCRNKRTGWVVSGECVALRCTDPLPTVAVATWDPTCINSVVGEFGPRAPGYVGTKACTRWWTLCLCMLAG